MIHSTDFTKRCYIHGFINKTNLHCQLLHNQCVFDNISLFINFLVHLFQQWQTPDQAGGVPGGQ